jgi:hypothetical protein
LLGERPATRSSDPEDDDARKRGQGRESDDSGMEAHGRGS